MRYIPRIIHLIWFGGNPYSPIVQRCVDSWKKYCPQYEIRVWDEKNFDVECNVFVKEAYENKMWAFVSDYVRLYALYHFGGIHIDADVEILRDFDAILENEHVVTGYSTDKWIPSGFWAAEKQNEWIKELLDYYDGRHFVKNDGSFDTKYNNAIITDISRKKFGFNSGDEFIKSGNVRLYPQHYFSPYKKMIFDFAELEHNDIHKYYDIIDGETVCVHHSMGSYENHDDTFFSRIKHAIRKYMPKPIVQALENIYYKRKYGA